MRYFGFFFFSSRRRHTRLTCDWSSDVCSSDLHGMGAAGVRHGGVEGLGVGVGLYAPAIEHGGEVRTAAEPRSEERRVGKECRSRWSPDHEKKKKNKKANVSAQQR